MSRTLTAGVEAAFAAEHVPLAYFVAMNFASGTVRVCNCLEDFTWGGFVWTGLGQLGTISALEESGETAMKGISLQLTGVQAALLATALTEDYQGRTVQLWVGPLDPATLVPVADPSGPYTYLMDVMSIEKGAEGTIVLTAEDRRAGAERPKVRRYTDEDQQLDYPGDRFFDMVPELQEKEILF